MPSLVLTWPRPSGVATGSSGDGWADWSSRTAVRPSPSSRSRVARSASPPTGQPTSVRTPGVQGGADHLARPVVGEARHRALAGVGEGGQVGVAVPEQQGLALPGDGVDPLPPLLLQRGEGAAGAAAAVARRGAARAGGRRAARAPAPSPASSPASPAVPVPDRRSRTDGSRASTAPLRAAPARTASRRPPGETSSASRTGSGTPVSGSGAGPVSGTTTVTPSGSPTWSTTCSSGSAGYQTTCERTTPSRAEVGPRSTTLMPRGPQTSARSARPVPPGGTWNASGRV